MRGAGFSQTLERVFPIGFPPLTVSAKAIRKLSTFGLKARTNVDDLTLLHLKVEAIERAFESSWSRPRCLQTLSLARSWAVTHACSMRRAYEDASEPCTMNGKSRYHRPITGFPGKNLYET